MTLDPFDFPFAADIIDAESDLSPAPLLVSRFDKEALGLSFLWLPGILDRIDPRIERDDSLVSDLLNEG